VDRRRCRWRCGRHRYDTHCRSHSQHDGKIAPTAVGTAP
jgi:hypothetical protein